jgi:hypothetical protein
LAEASRISGGKNFFTSGTPRSGHTDCQDVAVQRIAIRGRAGAIDANRIRLDAKVYIGTYDSQPDTAHVAVSFYNSSGISIAGGFSFSATHTAGYMLEKTTAKMVPVGTRSMKVFLFSSDTQGYCDAYFDRISLKIAFV